MFKQLCEKDLPLIRNWRNEEKVRRAMFTGHVISEQEHVSWWQRVKNDKTQQWLIYFFQEQEVGVVYFTDIDQDEMSWGFYLANDIASKKQQINIWETLEEKAIDYSFMTLNAKTLIAKVFAFNKPVIKMHQRFWFETIGFEQREKTGKMEQVLVMSLSQ